MKRILLFFIYLICALPVFSQIIITEIMFDPTPSVGLPEEEYIEIQNISQYPISMKGWKISDKKQVGILAGKMLLPDSLLILTSLSALEEFDGYGVAEALDTWPALNNDGDDIRLISPDGKVVDSVFYRPSWYNSSTKRSGGWSIERIDTDRLCQSSDNWAASLHPDGGTPGQVNSVKASNPDLRPPEIIQAVYRSGDRMRAVFSEEITGNGLGPDNFNIPGGPEITETHPGQTPDTIWLVLNGELNPAIKYQVYATNIADCAGNRGSSFTEILLPVAPEPNVIKVNEVLFDPYPGKEDFIEILNTGDKVIDLESLVLIIWDIDGAQDPDEIIFEGELLLGSGQWVVISPDPGEVIETYAIPSAPRNLKAPSMNIRNNGGLITLYANGKYQDSVKVSDEFHHVLLEDSEGFSLERTDYAIDGWLAAAWMTSAKKGTPGIKNTQRLSNWFDEGIMTTYPDVVIPGGIENNTLFIRLQLPMPGITGSLIVYSLSGTPVATVSHNELLSTDHVIRWDLIGDNGQIPLPGYYILFGELFGPGGFHKVLRQRVLIGR